jgi:hypothetical protein
MLANRLACSLVLIAPGERNMQKGFVPIYAKFCAGPVLAVIRQSRLATHLGGLPLNSNGTARWQFDEAERRGSRQLSISASNGSFGYCGRYSVSGFKKSIGAPQTVRISRAPKCRFIEPVQRDLPSPVPFAKIIAFPFDPNHRLILSCLIPHEGRWPSSRTLGWDAVDAAASGTQVAGRAGRKACEPEAACRRTMLKTAFAKTSADGYQARRKF